MAYSNWGAFVWKNGEFRKDCCDTGLTIGNTDIGGHAVINCDDLIFEIYKAYFPTIYEKQVDGTYKQWTEDEFIRHYGIYKLQYGIDINIKTLPEDKAEPDLSDFYYSFNVDSIIDFEYKGYKINFIGNIFEIDIPLNAIEIITSNNDHWYCVYGMSFGNGGYEQTALSKCHNKYICYDDGLKEYWYDCKNICIKMAKAYRKDCRKHEIHYLIQYIKNILKSIITLKFRYIPWQFKMMIDQLQKIF